MRVFVNIDNFKHYIACCEEHKVIHINRMGANKVASVCNTPVERFNTETLKIEIAKIKE